MNFKRLKFKWAWPRLALPARLHRLRLRVRRAQYRRALKVLGRGLPDWTVLLERLAQRLPLPLEVLGSRSSSLGSSEDTTQELLATAADMESQLQHGLAMKFFMGQIVNLHQAVVQRILQGEVDDFGNDITPQLRALLRAYESFMHIPQILYERRDMVHAQLGLKPDRMPAPSN